MHAYRDRIRVKQELLPIDPGFWGRRHLWKLWGYLASVTVDAWYLGMLTESIRKFARNSISTACIIALPANRLYNQIINQPGGPDDIDSQARIEITLFVG